MPDRTINFGESETEATYQIQDTDGAAGGGNFVVAKDTNANTVLLEYQPASDTWEYAGDVDMNGGNVSGVGTLTANSVNTGSLATNYEDGSEEVANRSFGQTYQNQNDYDIRVFIISTQLAGGETGVLDVYVEESSFSTGQNINRLDRSQADGDTAINRGIVSFKVPSGYHYLVDNSGDIGSADIANWDERGVTTN